MYWTILNLGAAEDELTYRGEVAFYDTEAEYLAGNDPVLVETLDIDLQPTRKAVATDERGHLILADGSTISPVDRQAEIEAASSVYAAAKEQFKADGDVESFQRAKATYASVAHKAFRSVEAEADNVQRIDAALQRWWVRSGRLKRGDHRSKRGIVEKVDPTGALQTTAGQSLLSKVDPAVRAKVDTRKVGEVRR